MAAAVRMAGRNQRLLLISNHHERSLARIGTRLPTRWQRLCFRQASRILTRSHIQEK